MFSWLKKKSSLPEEPNDLSVAVKENLAQNIHNLQDVAPAHFDAIYRAALRAISAGRDLKRLPEELMKIDGMTAHRAAEISRSLCNKASTIISIQRQLALGLQHAIWRHSGSPCQSADEVHQATDGKTFSIAEGMLVNGERIWPGYENGCKCQSKAIIPGFED